MNSNVVKITEKVPKDVKLSDGIYQGNWCGSICTISYLGKDYDVHVEEGIRGMSKAIVTIRNNSISKVETIDN